MHGRFIQSFDSVTDAVKLFDNIGKAKSILEQCLTSEHHFAYGFLWSTTLVDSLEPYVPCDSRFWDDNYKPTQDKHGPVI